MPKEIIGYITEDFLKKGWQKDDSAIFVYRRKSKSETWFKKVKLTLCPKKKK